MIESIKNANFQLTVNQDDPSPSGYTLRLRASWQKVPGWVPQYVVQLTGMNPLIGRDVETEQIKRTFTFDRNMHNLDGLRYHGKYIFRCYAIFEGTQYLIKEQPINLNFPDSRPRLSYTVSRKGSFTKITMKSNCWEYCSGRVWLSFDGHDQAVFFPDNLGDSYSFYLNTTGDVSVKIPDSTIEIN